jgi:DNA-binding CsgD family transcriptional regulator
VKISSIPRREEADATARNDRQRKAVYATGEADGGTHHMTGKGWIDNNIFCEHLGLTRREVEVLTLVADGKTNAEIGMILGTSPRTVQKHLEHIFEKLGVETRTAAAVRVLTLTAAQEPQIVPLPSTAT